MEEFLAIERREMQGRLARMKELSHNLGASEAKTEEGLKREEMEQQQRSRDGTE
jgi:hypothetical protein